MKKSQAPLSSSWLIYYGMCTNTSLFDFKGIYGYNFSTGAFTIFLEEAFIYCSSHGGEAFKNC